VKTIGLREAKQSLSDCVARSQREEILLLRHGKPAALIIGVEGHDLEDLILQRDPKFWRMIRQRRSEPTPFTLEDVERELPPKRRRKAASPGRRRRS